MCMCCLCGEVNSKFIKKLNDFFICNMCYVMNEYEIELNKFDCTVDELILSKLTVKKLTGDKKFNPKYTF